jgi:rhodanese-related sulfurtransferase
MLRTWYWRWRWSWIWSVVAMGWFGCQSGPSWRGIKEQIRSEFPNVRSITPEELELRLQAPDGEKPLLLDVREDNEFAVSHLRGAIRVPPDSDGSDQLESVPKDAPIVTYCSVGYRSAQLAKRLMEEGYTNVVNLEGSIFEWANKGYPVERDGHLVEQVHPFDPNWGKLLDPKLHAYEPSAP